MARVVGIPDREDLGDHSKLPVNELVDLVIQLHKARRAGQHYDVRIGNKDTGLLSWATRKGLPDPGKRHALFQQPVHSYDYKDFQGEIPEGYGAGTVSTHRNGRVLVTSVKPGLITFTTGDERYPQRYSLVRTKDDNWLAINNTPTKPVEYEKAHYKSIGPEQVEGFLDKLEPGSSVQAKIDGASSLIKLLDKHVELLSYRTSAVNGRPIVHTERFFQGRPEFKIPKDLQGSVLRGELYGMNKKNRPIPLQDLGGLLNSGLGKAIDSMRSKGTRLENAVFDIQRFGDKDLPSDKVPYHERRQMIDEVLQRVPGLTDYGMAPTPEATTSAAAHKLWQQIVKGKHPMTTEGIVIHPLVGRPVKAKIMPEFDVFVTGIYPGEGKYENTAAGGITYALKPGGPTVGRVGSGLSDSLRKEMWKDPQAFIGRVAKINAQEQTASGALRTPAFQSLHEDYSANDAAKQLGKIAAKRSQK